MHDVGKCVIFTNVLIPSSGYRYNRAGCRNTGLSALLRDSCISGRNSSAGLSLEFNDWFTHGFGQTEEINGL